MKTIIGLVFTILSFCASGQNNPTKNEKDAQIDTTRLIALSFPYPHDAKVNGIQGTVKIRLTFDAQCNIVKKEVIQSLGHGCDEESLKALTRLENRIKKKLLGNKCKDGQILIFPIQFRLE